MLESCSVKNNFSNNEAGFFSQNKHSQLKVYEKSKKPKDLWQKLIEKFIKNKYCIEKYVEVNVCNVTNKILYMMKY